MLGTFGFDIGSLLVTRRGLDTKKESGNDGQESRTSGGEQGESVDDG